MEAPSEQAHHPLHTLPSFANSENKQLLAEIQVGREWEASASAIVPVEQTSIDFFPLTELPKCTSSVCAAKVCLAH